MPKDTCAADSRSPLARTGSNAGCNSAATKRALVVDDNHAVALDLEGILLGLGFQVETCSDGGALKRMADRFDPHVILLDIDLGDTDAFEVMLNHLAGRFDGVVILVSGSPLEFIIETALVGERQGLSMGPCVTKPFAASDVTQALAEADVAMSCREVRRRGCAPRSGSPQRINVADALRLGALEVWYQPKYRIDDEHLVGAEALVRARLAGEVLVSPFELLANASKRDLHGLTDFVLNAALDNSRSLAQAGAPLKLAVNMPASYVTERSPASFVRGAAKEPWWPGMTFEITEDEALANTALVRDFALQLRLYSVNLSIDDFGAGYSSLSRLKDIPFSEIKIDRSFVHGCASDSAKLSICKGVIGLGRDLDCVTVAEGVEEENDLEALRSLGCDVVQGYLYSRPITFAALLEMVGREAR